MAQKRIHEQYPSKEGLLDVTLSLIAYEDEGLQVIYSPALDLFGYGKSEQEAKRSFEITLEEFVKYTTNKSTLWKELKRMGWKVPGNKSKPKAPDLDTLLRDNEQFSEIFNEKEYRKYNQHVSVPIYA